MIFAIILTVLFLASAAWVVVESLDNREPQIYVAAGLMITLALACGGAWENLGA